MSQEDFVMPSEGGGSYSLPPAGSYQAVCCEMLKYEPRLADFTDQKTGEKGSRPVHEVQYVFQLNKVDPETGKRYEVRSRKMNKLFSEKATLRAFFLQMRGHDLTPEELKPPGIQITQLVGKNAMIQIVHAPSRNGDKTYANIGSIMPLFEGMPPIAPLNYQSHQQYVTQAQSQAQPAAAPVSSGTGSNGYPTPQHAQQAVAVAADDIPF